MATAEMDCGPAGYSRITGKEGLIADLEAIAGDKSIRVVLSQGEGAILTWQNVVNRLAAEAPALRDLLSDVLRRLPFKAVFWECVPVSRATSNRPFEFVAVDAPELEHLEADYKPFEKKLESVRGKETSQAFTNLGGDSTLVSPAWATEDVKAYTHAASFFREAPKAQQDAQWRVLGDEIAKRFAKTDAPFWVSTAGNAVSWLHMRLDPTPKYYNHVAYKDPNYGYCRIPGDDGLMAVLETMTGDKSIRVVLSQGEGDILTWQQVADGLTAEAPALRDLYSDVLRRLPFKAFFWECVPVSRATSNRPFEFVAVDAPELEHLEADYKQFEKKLESVRGKETSQAFTNLGGDSTLVSPAWATEDVKAYTHAASFFREASELQQDAQWRVLGDEIAKRFAKTDAPFWVSTAGKAVSWLHMRMDPTPKYYNHVAYKDPAYGVAPSDIPIKSEESRPARSGLVPRSLSSLPAALAEPVMEVKEPKRQRCNVSPEIFQRIQNGEAVPVEEILGSAAAHGGCFMKAKVSPSHAG
jgi:hypothetical protein